MKQFAIIILALVIFINGCTPDVEIDATIYEQDFVIRTVTDQLDYPWGMDFINESIMIVTQKPGKIALIDTTSGEIINLQNVPQIAAVGQGGMLDVAIDDNWIYMTYTDSYEGGITTHLARAELNLETYILENFEVLYRALPAISGGAHFGSRVIIQDDYVFFSVGDRGDKNFGSQHVSQNTSNTLGTTIRLYKNGSIPKDNPFIGNNSVVDSIYTFGHRNVQGMTINPFTNEIWQSEHGEQDGDVINILQAGGNYGWPITHYGCTYGTGKPIGEYPHQNPEVINPVYHWECNSGGFPPSGMTFYDSDKFKEWQGNLFVGNLGHQYLGRFKVNGREVKELEPLVKNKGWRIRDVAQSPDGYLYFIVDASPGGLYRIEPR